MSNKDIFNFELIEYEMADIRAHDPDAPGIGEWLLSNYDVHAND